MEQKFQIWFKEINELTEEQESYEIKMMKMEIQLLEFKMFIHELCSKIKMQDKQIEELYTGLKEARNLLRS
jgi:CII-binding regulator of phage lambda lysogenization HflD